ncbi:MAG: hypothetical protein K0B81_08175 [Candidatus Cloacimonetes bacterium]|nr:hypothetical protein [Candidatus Cloacimonadota bacterium]
MKKILGNVIKVLGWLVLLIAFASIGFATDNPQLMVPLYFLIFLVIFALLLLYNMKRQRKSTEKPKFLGIFRKIFGAILIIIGVLMPYFFFRGIGFAAGMYVILTILTIILIGLAIIAIRLIDQLSILKTIGGYVLLVIVCAMPAILMMQYDKSYNALGSAYYAALIICVLTWTGINMLASPREFIKE